MRTCDHHSAVSEDCLSAIMLLHFTKESGLPGALVLDPEFKSYATVINWQSPGNTPADREGRSAPTLVGRTQNVGSFSNIGSHNYEKRPQNFTQLCQVVHFSPCDQEL